MPNHNNKFSGNIGYGVVGPTEFEEFDFSEMNDTQLFDEIEKALLEIKDTLDIPEKEIDDAINSRRFFRLKCGERAHRS